jgi:hypothetical protein
VAEIPDDANPKYYYGGYGYPYYGYGPYYPYYGYRRDYPYTYRRAYGPYYRKRSLSDEASEGVSKGLGRYGYGYPYKYGRAYRRYFGKRSSSDEALEDVNKGLDKYMFIDQVYGNPYGVSRDLFQMRPLAAKEKYTIPTVALSAQTIDVVEV